MKLFLNSIPSTMLVLSVGRSDENNIQIPFNTVSGHHGDFIRRGNEWYYEDHLKNGTVYRGAASGLLLKDRMVKICAGDVLSFPGTDVVLEAL